MFSNLKNRPQSQVAPTLVFSLLTLPLAATSQAKEYSFDYHVKGRYTYNDNVNMAPNSGIDIAGIKLNLPATLTMRSERLATSLMGEVATSKYEIDGYNSDDQNLQGNTTYQLERGSVTGQAGFKRYSTRDSAFLDTGVVGFSASRVEAATAGGNGQYMFTEKNGVTASVNYRQTNYDSPRFRDNEFISGYSGWLHQWSERTQLRLQGSAARFENDAQLGVVSTSYGVQAGFDSMLSEQLQVSLLAGWTTVDSDYDTNSSIAAPDEDNTSGYVVDGSLDYQQERYTLEAKLKRSARPSGDGYLVVANRLEMSYRYDVSERSLFTLRLIGGSNGAVDSRINNDRKFALARVSMDYHLSRAWYVGGGYTFKYQDRDRSSGTATSNAVYLSLTLDPEKYIWSR